MILRSKLVTLCASISGRVGSGSIDNWNCVILGNILGPLVTWYQRLMLTLRDYSAALY